MAIYHCSAGMIRRSRGRSATAAAAYRAGEKITDERTGLVHDYREKGGVDYKGSMNIRAEIGAKRQKYA